MVLSTLISSGLTGSVGASPGAVGATGSVIVFNVGASGAVGSGNASGTGVYSGSSGIFS